MRKLSNVEIKAIRGSAGMSQERLGRLLGVSGRTIGHWETGICIPPPIYQLCLRQLRNKIHSMRERFPARKTRQIVRGFQGEIAEFLAWIFNES